MGAVAGIVGGVASKVIGGAVSKVAGGVISSLASKFGGSSIVGAIGNIFAGHAGTALKGLIAGAPIPSFLKGAANGIIDKVLGQLRQQVPAEAEGQVNQHCGEHIKECAHQCVGEAGKHAEGKTGLNWLVALAQGLAQTQTKHLEKMLDAQEKMNAEDQGGDAKANGKAYNEASATFQAESKLFAQATEQTSTVLKTIGESLSSLARKQ